MADLGALADLHVQVAVGGEADGEVQQVHAPGVGPEEPRPVLALALQPRHRVRLRQVLEQGVPYGPRLERLRGHHPPHLSWETLRRPDSGGVRSCSLMAGFSAVTVGPRAPSWLIAQEAFVNSTT